MDTDVFVPGLRSPHPQDVDADGGILFLEERDLFDFHRIIYSGHVECGFVTGII